VPKTTDAVMGLDMDTGKILWAMQDTAGDSYLSGCGNAQDKPENCPDEEGPDFDFGASPILRTLPNGSQILVAGQKSGTVWAHDPDHEGVLVWKYQMGDKPTFGMFVWGAAADNQTAYFGMRTGGVTALDWATGKKRWIARTATQHDFGAE
jgi:polyvinyl alcohol dehydrogenase (cytochrome)